jgi:Zn-dependent protease
METREETKRRLRRRNRNSLLLGGLFIALATWFILEHRIPMAVIAGAFLVSYLASVILHELGHAAAAIAAGGAVNYITLGRHVKDRKPWRIRFLGLRWYLYGLPASGAVHLAFYSTRRYRLRQCFVIAMGPAVNLALLVLGCVVMPGFHEDADGGLDLGGGFVFGLILANGYLLLGSAWPRRVTGMGRITANDGLLFWRTLQYSDDEVRQFVEHAVSTRELRSTTAEAEDMTLEELLASHERDPGNIAYLWYLANALHENDDPRYPDFALKLLDLPNLTPKARVSTIDIYLTWQLQHGSPAQPDVADRLSRQLVELDDCTSTRGTRGSVLVDLGRLEEGKAMLQEVLARTNGPIEKSYSNIFLALAAKAEGDEARARELAQAARKADPACPALKRVADLLKPAAASVST